MAMSLRNRLLRFWAYFRRGHSTYLAFFISFANFVVIQYRLLIEHIPVLKLFFASLTAFAVTFFLVYIPLAILIGWLDYKKIAVPIDAALTARASPYAKSIARSLYILVESLDIPQEKKEEIKKVLEPWI